MDKIVEALLEKELGGVAYNELAAARDEDNAARGSNYIPFSILLASIVFSAFETKWRHRCPNIARAGKVKTEEGL